MQERLLSQCAVLFGIPTDRAQFSARAQTSDYLSKLLTERDVETAWREDYEGVAAAAQGLITTAHRVGAHVFEHAALADLADATRTCSTVVLFAHWRGAKIDVGDLLAEPDVLSRKMQEHPYFRHCYASDKDGIVDILNSAIEDMRLLDNLPSTIVAVARRSRSIAQTLCRDLLDEFLSGLLVPGNRLELFSGLYTPAEVDQAIFAEFEGEIDLALCHSEALATFLDLRRGDRLRHLHWPTLVHPTPQLLKVEATLELIEAEGGNYIETRLLVEEAEMFS